MHISIEMLFDSFKDSIVVDFVRRNILQSYKENFPGYESEISAMVETSFQHLLESTSSGIDTERLEKTVSFLSGNIFKTKDKNFWFNQGYLHYKNNIRPEKDYEKISKYILGKKVLDFGSGGGYLAAKLSDIGYEVMTTDVLDYRSNRALKLPFTLMEKSDRLPKYHTQFNTVFSKTVFHHVEPGFLNSILGDISKITQRLIIEEDTYDVSNDTEGYSVALENQAQLKEFVQIGKVRQKKSLILLDFFANNIALGIIDMNCPFQFKTIDEWRDVLSINQFDISKVIFSGFESKKMHKNCQVWMICDRKSV